MNLLKKTITVFIVIACIIGFVCPMTTQAISVSVSDIRIAPESEKRTLLGGTTVEEAREEYVLGIASKFAVFVEDTFEHTKADIGGKAAIGKKFVFNSEAGQVGCEYYNYQKSTHDGSADLILGTGENGAWNHGNLQIYSSTKYGNSYGMPKLIVVPTVINTKSIGVYSSWKENWVTSGSWFSLDKKASVVRADLIDFEEEFEHLRSVSQNLASMESTGTVIESEREVIVTNREYGDNSKNRAIPGTIFRGENPFYNIFNVTSEKWNSYDNIIFDVPYNSYVIINIDGDNIVFSDQKPNEEWATCMAVKNIFYPISRSEILEDGLEEKEPAYLLEKNSWGSYNITARDEEGYVKTYVKLLSADEKNWDKGEYILYNLPNATSFTFDGNWVGAILAPEAAGSNVEPAYNCGGHLAGNLICKKYYRGQEFGNTLFSMTNSYLNLEEIEVNSTDRASSDKVVPGAIMQIRDIKGNVIYKWETTNESKKVQLPKGKTFILEEVNVPEGYTAGEPVAFQIDNNGNVFIVNTVVSYSEIETVGTVYSNLTTSEACNHINNTGINKIEFVPDTSESTYKPDWGLDCRVVGRYYTGTGYTQREDLVWTHTDDGETVTTYLPIYKADSERGIIYFYRGNTQVSDVKLKTLTTYKDSETTKTTAKDTKHVQTNAGTIKFLNTPETGIRVNIDKVEKGSDVKVAGAGFGLYSAEKNDLFEKDELIAGGVTDAKGNLVLERYATPVGKYYVKEISTPSAYIPSDEIWEYEISEEKILEENIKIENEVAKTIVNISKKSVETQETIPEVAFGVFAKEDTRDASGNLIYLKDNLVYDKKTGQDGTLQMVFSKNDKYLPLGKYYIKEIGGTSSVIYDDTIYEIEIAQENKEYTFDIENDCTKVEILQVDSVEGMPIAGAKLQVQNENGDIVREFITTEDAYRINSLPLGKYKLVEIQPAEGYLPAEPIEFTVKSTEEVQKVEMKSDYTQVEIIKVDTLEGTPVVGSKLQIKNEEGEIVDEWITGENAFKIDKLPLGKYTLVVVESAENYLMFDGIEFEVTDKQGVTTVNVQAEKQTEEDLENKEDEKQEETQTENKNEQINKEDETVAEEKKENTVEAEDNTEQTNQEENKNQTQEKAELQETTNKSENSVATGDKILSIVISLVVASIALAISIRYKKNK